MSEPIQSETETPSAKAAMPEMTCYRHPDQKTMLRCSSCLNPICPDCARSSPTGYICPDCLSGRRKVFDTAMPRDYLFAALIAAVLGFAGAYLTAMIPFMMIWAALIGGGISGTVIANVIRFATGKRRSARLIWTAALASAVGATVYFAPAALFSQNWIAVLSAVLFIVIMANAIATNYGTTLRFPKR